MKQLNEMNITEKKAMAYDILANLENLQRQLQLTNQSISEEMNKPKEFTKPTIVNDKINITNVKEKEKK